MLSVLGVKQGGVPRTLSIARHQQDMDFGRIGGPVPLRFLAQQLRQSIRRRNRLGVREIRRSLTHVVGQVFLGWHTLCFRDGH